MKLIAIITFLCIQGVAWAGNGSNRTFETQDRLTTFVASPSGNQIATGHDSWPETEATLLITSIQGKQVYSQKFSGEEIEGLKWTPNENYLIVGSFDSGWDLKKLVIRIFDTSNWSLHYEIKSKNLPRGCTEKWPSAISDLPVNFERFFVATNGCVVDSEWSKIIAGFHSHWLKFTHDFRYAISAGKNGIELYHIPSEAKKQWYSEEDSFLAWFNADESKVLGVTKDKPLLFDAKTGSKLVDLEPARRELSWAKFSRDDLSIVGIQEESCCVDKQIVLWDIKSGKRTESKSVVSGDLIYVEMLKDGSVVAAEFNGKISIVRSL